MHMIAQTISERQARKVTGLTGAVPAGIVSVGPPQLNVPPAARLVFEFPVR